MLLCLVCVVDLLYVFELDLIVKVLGYVEDVSVMKDLKYKVGDICVNC